MQDRYWEKMFGHVTESEIDVRWILRDPSDDKAYGSLRIVSHPDCKPGHMRAYSSFVVSRKPKTQEEIQQSIEECQMEEHELELYTLHEHIKTTEMVHEDRYQKLEEIFGVKIFS